MSALGLAILSSILALAGLQALLEWRRARSVLARIRGEWGMPRVRERDMAAIASYHAALTAHHLQALSLTA